MKIGIKRFDVFHQNQNKNISRKSAKMIFREIVRRQSVCVKRFSRQIHIHREIIKGSNGQIIIAHGMLGSLSNWSSLSRRIAKETGKSVITFDARNHGLSEHHESMSYQDMSQDMKSLITDENVTLVGHSMGGRTCMYLALKWPELGKILQLLLIFRQIEKFFVKLKIPFLQLTN